MTDIWRLSLLDVIFPVAGVTTSCLSAFSIFCYTFLTVNETPSCVHKLFPESLQLSELILKSLGGYK